MTITEEERTTEQWEYKAKNLNHVLGMNLEHEFNKLGREGWEFVAVTGEKKDHYALFKRRLH